MITEAPMTYEHEESTAEILRAWKGKEPREIACRLCGARVRDDAPDAIWQGFKGGLTSGFAIDEHESGATWWRRRWRRTASTRSSTRSSTPSVSPRMTAAKHAACSCSEWDTDGSLVAPVRADSTRCGANLEKSKFIHPRRQRHA